jgi:hypothetical protein
VADGVDPAERSPDGGRVANVGADQLGTGVEVGRRLTVHGRVQRVQHPHVVVAKGEQRVDDVGADEAGATGDEDLHRRALYCRLAAIPGRNRPCFATRNLPTRNVPIRHDAGGSDTKR